MDGYQIIDALSASFFALLGIWAAVDRHHWFFRFAVVGGLLLVALFLPAYEVVIEFGLQLTIIITVIWLARKPPGWQVRLSMESALLMMVVAAVVAAVIGGIPSLEPAVWCFLVTVGVCTAYAGLLALWLVCGRAPRRVRALILLPGVMLFTALFHFGHALQHALWRSSSGFNWNAFAEFYGRQHTGGWLQRTLPTIALASVVLGVALQLAKSSRLFTPGANTPAARPLPRRAVAARLALAATLIAVATPLAYLFYKLMTPPALSELPPLPAPNGFDDFVAAGKMGPPDYNALRVGQFAPLMPQLEEIADRIAEGLAKESLVPLTPGEERLNYMGMAIDELIAVQRACEALFVRANYLQSYGSVDDRIASRLLLIKLTQAASRGATGIGMHIGWYYQHSCNILEGMLGVLDEPRLLRLISELCAIDAGQGEFDATARRQLIINCNGSWSQHLPIVVDLWAGKDPLEPFRPNHTEQTAWTRLLRTQAAAQAYFLRHDRLPDSLADLVPEFLESAPVDPFDNQPLRFRRQGQTYTLYSVGRDGFDHQAHPTMSARDDLIVTGPKYPPQWMQLRDRVVTEFGELWQPPQESTEKR